MQDRLKRNITYLRVSVTDRCNLRCVYCMPEGGVEYIPHEEILSFEEIVKVCEAAAAQGISKIKLTGGEPLARKNLEVLVEELKNIQGIDKVTLTTNGLLLEEHLDALVAAGLDAVNISIDALDEEAFKRVTGSYGAAKVMAAINKAAGYEKLQVKVNCVPIIGMNEANLLRMAEIAKHQNVHVRFIEMMPIGLGRQFETLKEAVIINKLEQQYGMLIPYHNSLGNGPCHYFTIRGFKGKIGFISAVSHKFCDRCNRVRLTSTGFLKTCLQYDQGVDLKRLLRTGSGPEELAEKIKAAVFDKPAAHQFGQIEAASFENRRMHEIGG